MVPAIELILAGLLASGLSVPVLLVDTGGDTVVYNEPAKATAVPVESAGGQVFGALIVMWPWRMAQP